MEYDNLIQQAEQVVNESTGPALSSALTKVLADTFLFYFKSHSFHWNVVGKDFPQYHEFLEKIYTQVYPNIDRLAEEVRALDSIAPLNLATLISNSSLSENTLELSALSMMTVLSTDNNKILANLLACQKMADAANEIGLSNYLQDLFDSHKKLAWMLAATLKV